MQVADLAGPPQAPPALAVQRTEQARAVRDQELPNSPVEQHEPHRMTGGEQDALAAGGRFGKAGSRLFQAAEHSDGIHRDRAVDPGRRDVGVEARSLAHQRHHLALREHAQAGQAELRAGIAGGELGDLPPNVRPVV